MSWYLAPWKKYASFSGRARRTEFWLWTLINIVVYFGLAGLATSMDSNALFYVAIAFALVMTLPAIAVTVRRLHDTGRSGAWYFISFVPFIGGFWLLALTLLAGEQGENAYGPNPKAA